MLPQGGVDVCHLKAGTPRALRADRVDDIGLTGAKAEACYFLIHAIASLSDTGLAQAPVPPSLATGGLCSVTREHRERGEHVTSTREKRDKVALQNSDRCQSNTNMIVTMDVVHRLVSPAPPERPSKSTLIDDGDRRLFFAKCCNTKQKYSPVALTFYKTQAPAIWSAGPKCGNYFHAAESGRRCDMTKCSVDTSVRSLRHTQQASWTAV